MKRCYFTTKGLTVGYDGAPLIKDITVEVDRGEIVALIGPNGAGKSTILKTITRQLKALGGRVFVGGEELARLSHEALAKRMAVVLTERMKPELMTCRDVVATGRYPYTGRLGILSPADEAVVEASMAAVRVLDIRDRDFGQISDGQRQRVLLARAICQEPEIIVLDEPTSFLDIRHKLELLTILRDMARQKGIAVILSLHEIDLAQRVADRVICVRGETIARVGTPEDVLTEASVRELYELEHGGFDPAFGSIELPPPQGEPKTLVLSAGGTGIPVYRRLQREGVPFVAGILYENDVDYRVAKRLAADVIAEKPFMPISDAAFERAMDWVRRCDRVIDAGVVIGETNARMFEVIQAAGEKREQGTGIVWERHIG